MRLKPKGSGFKIIMVSTVTNGQLYTRALLRVFVCISNEVKICVEMILTCVEIIFQDYIYPIRYAQLVLGGSPAT